MSNKIIDLNGSESTKFKSISKFYEGANILLTGTTGFIGKVVLEKLLRSCKSSGKIYILIRSKKGVNPDERLQQLFESPAFSQLREQNPKVFKKVKLISGDLQQPNLGLNQTERNLLTENVNVVLHSAADVRLVQPLQDIIKSNTVSTKEMVALCKDMKYLKSFVYVSTAFINKDEVEEIVYDTSYDPDFIINCMNNLPADIIELMTIKLMGENPNTYVISKILAERIVLEASDYLPTVIVRPSLVHSSWKEPFPGWTDSFSSITPLAMAMNQGTLKTVNCNTNLVADIIPVDIVANTIIAAAWHAQICRSNSTKVYNCASGTVNKITFRNVIKLLHKYALEYPTQHIMSYPSVTFVKSKKLHKVFSFLYDFVPAFMHDVYLYCTNNELRMLKKCKQMTFIMKLYESPMTEYRTFHTNNFKTLIEAVNQSEDGDVFNIDFRQESGFNWDCYIKNCQLGLRQYILKDDMSSLSVAKTKLKRLYWTKKINQLAFICLMLGLVFWIKWKSAI